jgi:phage major head subunit gpT-like protein
LTKGIKNQFFKTFDAVPTFYERLATRIPSTSESETYKFLGQTPQMREWGTGRVAKGLRTESYTVANLKYEATLEVDRDELSDAQLPQIMVRVRELADRAASHKDYLISQLLINGITTGFNSYDGLSFFNDAHTFGDSGNQDNKLAPGATAPDAPTVAECSLALKQAVSAMMQFKDDRGEVLPISLTGMVIACHPTPYLTWLETVTSKLVSNSDNILTKFTFDVIPVPWLTDVSAWYLLKTDGHVGPFIFQDREPIELKDLTGDSDAGFMREVYLYGVRARYRLTYGEWRNAIYNNFA